MAEDSAHFPPVEPVRAGLAGKCPRCGQGRLFRGFLAVAPCCRNCGLDFSFADAGDGPAVFVIMIVGFVVVGLALWLELAHGPPLWLHFILWVPLTLGLSLALLRAAKGILVTLQYHHDAHEGGIHDR